MSFPEASAPFSLAMITKWRLSFLQATVSRVPIHIVGKVRYTFTTSIQIYNTIFWKADFYTFDFYRFLWFLSSFYLLIVWALCNSNLWLTCFLELLVRLPMASFQWQYGHFPQLFGPFWIFKARCQKLVSYSIFDNWITIEASLIISLGLGVEQTWLDFLSIW